MNPWKEANEALLEENARLKAEVQRLALGPYTPTPETAEWARDFMSRVENVAADRADGVSPGVDTLFYPALLGKLEDVAHTERDFGFMEGHTEGWDEYNTFLDLVAGYLATGDFGALRELVEVRLHCR